ncbi:alpha/beta hydrolase fold domain-containing protein [Streptomyces sp. NPDC097610]|uniref:alpha/beta hydrolase fold domain-containing protein n=1 Tax=Streptomyces sp. NPDC097610 TaxID=3157227 RepID=UPI0033324805
MTAAGTDSSYVPDPRVHADRLVSSAGAADTADLKGIAPPLVVTAEYDLLKAQAVRYAERLQRAGALVEHQDVLGNDHEYDGKDDKKALETYAVIARHVRRAVNPEGREAG